RQLQPRTAEPREETVTPRGERGHLLLERCIVVGKKRLELEVVLGELLPGGELDLIELRIDALGGGVVEREVVHVVLEPLAARRPAADAHRAAHAAVQLRQRDDHAGLLERLAQSTVFRSGSHASAPTCRIMLTLPPIIIDPSADAALYSAHERRLEHQPSFRSRAPTSREAIGGAGAALPPAPGREPVVAAAARDADRGACDAAAEERASTRPGRGDDRAPEGDGAGLMSDVAYVTIKILEKEYHVACPSNEKADLLASAELLNRKMREIRDSGKVVGLDRVAVMAALNLANDLIKIQGQDEELQNIVGVRIRALRERLDSALGPAKQLNL